MYDKFLTTFNALFLSATQAGDILQMAGTILWNKDRN